MKYLLSTLLLIFTLVSGGNAMATETNLSAQEAAIIPIAAFTANGDTAKLGQALTAGLAAGLTVNQIKEILIQMYAYCGFPRSLTGLAIFMNLLDERAKQGIKDIPGQAPKQLPKDANRNKLGTEIQTGLVGKPVKGPLFEFSPTIDAFLKEHLFCDIFSRGVLTNQERELATIAALATLPAPSQLASHLAISLNTGLSDQQLQNFVEILKEKVGEPEAKLAEQTLAKVLEQQKAK